MASARARKSSVRSALTGGWSSTTSGTPCVLDARSACAADATCFGCSGCRRNAEPVDLAVEPAVGPEVVGFPRGEEGARGLRSPRHGRRGGRARRSKHRVERDAARPPARRRRAARGRARSRCRRRSRSTTVANACAEVTGYSSVRGPEVEPAEVALPERAHRPAHPAVLLADPKVVGEPDLAHEGEDVGTGVDAVERGPMHVVDGAAQPAEAGVDEVRARDRLCDAP